MTALLLLDELIVTFDNERSDTDLQNMQKLDALVTEINTSEIKIKVDSVCLLTQSNLYKTEGKGGCNILLCSSVQRICGLLKQYKHMFNSDHNKESNNSNYD
eukprot:60234_1